MVETASEVQQALATEDGFVYDDIQAASQNAER